MSLMKLVGADGIDCINSIWSFPLDATTSFELSISFVAATGRQIKASRSIRHGSVVKIAGFLPNTT